MMPSDRTLATVGGCVAAIIIAALVGLGVLLTLLLAPARTCAQDLALERPELPALELPACPGADTLTVRDGELRAPRPVADCMLGRLRGLPALVRYVHLLEERLRAGEEIDALRARETELAAREAELAAEQVEAATAAAAAADDAARAAEEELDAWYRHPVLLVGLGVVLTVALEIAAVFVFREVGP